MGCGKDGEESTQAARKKIVGGKQGRDSEV